MAAVAAAAGRLRRLAVRLRQGILGRVRGAVLQEKQSSVGRRRAVGRHGVRRERAEAESGQAQAGPRELDQRDRQGIHRVRLHDEGSAAGGGAELPVLEAAGLQREAARPDRLDAQARCDVHRQSRHRQYPAALAVSRRQGVGGLRLHRYTSRHPQHLLGPRRGVGRGPPPSHLGVAAGETRVGNPRGCASHHPVCRRGPVPGRGRQPAGAAGGAGAAGSGRAGHEVLAGRPLRARLPRLGKEDARATGGGAEVRASGARGQARGQARGRACGQALGQAGAAARSPWGGGVRSGQRRRHSALAGGPRRHASFAAGAALLSAGAGDGGRQRRTSARQRGAVSSRVGQGGGGSGGSR
mmetsp:Transcript_108414/g.294031  ORF Transcript_108414/g.294031 Transcript_108414/m.294031 type:complete len:355 (+) Transcript_108414:1454-2518(+)